MFSTEPDPMDVEGSSATIITHGDRGPMDIPASLPFVFFPGAQCYVNGRSIEAGRIIKHLQAGQRTYVRAINSSLLQIQG
jgi:hypothetical protein